MTADDLPAVMEIERLSFPEPWSTGLFLHELKLPFSRCRVVRAPNGSNPLIGYAIWWLVGDEVQILNIAVHPDYRRSGAARLMLEEILADARAGAATSVSLEVRHDNESARRLYEGFGFVEKGVRRHYYGRGNDALIMTLAL